MYQRRQGRIDSKARGRYADGTGVWRIVHTQHLYSMRVNILRAWWRGFDEMMRSKRLAFRTITEYPSEPIENNSQKTRWGWGGDLGGGVETWMEGVLVSLEICVSPMDCPVTL